MTPAVQALIAANVVVMFLQWTLVGDADTFRWLAYRDGAIPGAWWTLATYMFVHGGLLHLAVNMYTLWMFGPRLERSLGTPRFTALYAWSGLGGVALHALLGGEGYMVGASGAVFGVMFGYALFWPREEVLLFGVLPMRVMALVALLGVFNLLQGLSGPGSGVAHFAHLGGFAFAFLFLRAPAMLGLDRARQQVAELPDEDARPRAIQRPTRPRERGDEVDEIVAKSRAATAIPARPRIAPPRPAPRAATEPTMSEIDRVLDKISASGIDSLTGDERATLDAFARRLQKP